MISQCIFSFALVLILSKNILERARRNPLFPIFTSFQEGSPSKETEDGVKKGSVLLMILIIMVALVALIHSMLRASSYLMLLAHEREVYEKKG